MILLEDILNRHGLHAVIYAGDTQLYIACDSRADPSIVARNEACIDEIRRWMRANLLALNDGKTEIVWFSSKQKKLIDQPVENNVRIGDVMMSP